MSAKAASAAKFPLRAAAALFLERQWLDAPRTRRLNARTLEDFVAATCGLQIDSIHVIDRAHHLTLWSRFGAYDRAKLERLTYRDRVIFEYLTHVACFVARRDLPLVRHYMHDTPARFEKRYPGWMRRYGAVCEQVERAIAERGPLTNADFEREGGGKAGGWWSWKPAQHALDHLVKAGRIVVASRTHFHKTYDLASRVMPATLEPPAFDAAGTTRERVLRSFAAMGAATFDDLRSYWTWPGVAAGTLRATLDALLAEDRVRRIALEGADRPWFARTEDLPELARAARRRQPSRGTTLLSPFDSFLWHRERTLRLFGFHYRIEVYVPAAKRAHGYYSLPLLHDGQLIGRFDLKTHREERMLELKHAHFENWFAKGEAPPAAAWGRIDRDAAIAGAAEALRELARHVGADRVEVRRATPAKFTALVRTALRAGE